MRFRKKLLIRAHEGPENTDQGEGPLLIYTHRCYMQFQMGDVRDSFKFQYTNLCLLVCFEGKKEDNCYNKQQQSRLKLSSSPETVENRPENSVLSRA